MMRALKTRWLLLPALFVSLHTLRAQVPTGEVTYGFDRTTYPVWDFSGPYTFSQVIVGAGGTTTEMVFSLSITQSLGGSLSGQGVTMVTLHDGAVPDVAAVHFTATGSVSQGGNSTHLSLTVHLVNDGLDLIGWQYRTFKANLTYNLRVNPDANTEPALIAPLSGAPVRGSVSIGGLGSAAVVAGGDPAAYSVTLPPGVDGAWGVTLNLVSIGQHIAGTGAVIVDSYAQADNPVGATDYRLMAANVGAKYTARQNVTSVTLTPFAGSSPMSLQLSFVTGALRPLKVSGKILGQPVRD